MNNASKGFLIALAGYSLYTFGDTIMKALSQEYPLSLRMMIAYLSAAVVISLITSLTTKNLSPLKPKNPYTHIIRAIIVMIAQGSCFLAYAHLPLANTYAILYLVPLCVAFMAGPLLNEWPSKIQIAAIIMGWVGAYIIIQPGYGDISIGYLYALCGMIFIAINQIFIRKFGQTETAQGLSFSAQLLVGLIMAPFAYPHIDTLNMHDFMLLVLMGTFAGTAMVLVTKGAMIAPAGRASPAIYVQILWGMFFGFVLFNDIPQMVMLFGALLVITSGAVLLIDKYKLLKRY